jgi:glycosyltransferase 2 family protein
VQRALSIAKVAVTVAALGAMLAAADLPALGRLLAAAEPGYFVAAVGVLAVQTLALAARFRAITAALGRPIRARFAVEVTFIGALFNQALPSAVGGDAVRVWRLRAEGRSWRNAVVAVLLDRASGVLVLALLACVAVAAEPSGALAPLRLGLWLVVAAGAAAAAIAATADRLPPMPHATRRLLAASGVPAGTRALLAPRAAFAAAAYSAASHLLAVLALFLLAAALGIEATGAVFLAAALCVLLATMIPLSYAGWGIREAGAVWLFAFAGIDTEGALAISVLFGAALLAAALPGLTFWLLPSWSRASPLLAPSTLGVSQPDDAP